MGTKKQPSEQSASAEIMAETYKVHDWTQYPPFPPRTKLAPGVWDRKSAPPKIEPKPLEIKVKTK